MVHIILNYSSFQCAAAVPGYDIRAFGNDGKEVPPNTLGTLAIKLPLPPGTLPTLYNNDERYMKEYLTKFPGYYDTMDAGVIDEDGYVSILQWKQSWLTLF